MKNTLFLKFTITFLIYQNSFAQPCLIDGYIQGLGSKKVIVRYQKSGNEKVDTLLAVNNHFSYKAKPSDDGQFRLYMDSNNPGHYTLLWYEPGIIKVNGTIEKHNRLTVSGTRENNLLNSYKRNIEWIFEDKRKNQPDSVRTILIEEKSNATLHYISKHPSARTSAYLLYWQTFYQEDFLSTYEKLYKSFTPSVRTSFYGKQLANRLQLLESQPRTGKIAPVFTLADTAGKLISLKDYKGSYVLLNFWGHWCPPCIQAIPKLKNINMRYANKLIIIGLAAEDENDKLKWIRTVQNNNLNWVQLSELKGDGGEVNKLYNITSFPTYLIIDKNGIVLRRLYEIKNVIKLLEDLNDI
ncbi:TlpA disulfide reductase family protein [Nibrella saemangeumensis]|uniref:TlpA disulfide reductase family protein n=1 Tax=Nibrella saemangeumensis TaxID=1084526 RepID=A0ABP8N3U3_9BACT